MAAPSANSRLAVLRRNIGFVPQETFLFSDTIRGNIAFGSPKMLRTRKFAAPPKPPTSP
jgi:ABC-type multidrug transport system fused ATPase/permease subunit